VTAALKPEQLAVVDLPSDAPLAERRLAALNLRYIRGMTYAQIADELNISEKRAADWVLRAARDTCRRPIDAKLDRQHTVLNSLITGAFDEAQGGDNDARMFVLRCLEHAAKLDGLYAPARVQVGISETEFGAQAAALLAAIGGVSPGQNALREIARLPSARPVIDTTIEPSPPPGPFDGVDGGVDVVGAQVSQEPQYAEVVELLVPAASPVDDDAWSNL
jgi:hypothetical protein